MIQLYNDSLILLSDQKIMMFWCTASTLLKFQLANWEYIDSDGIPKENSYIDEGDVILDTFLGSGTTALACKNTNRNFKGCEINKVYFDELMKLI